MAKSQTASVDEHRERLMQQRQEIMDLYNADVRAGQASTDEGTDDIVDRANNSYNRELMFSLSDNERTHLLAIDAALERLEAGTYGTCANCNREIGEKRLEAVPWARFCINCQELVEQGMLEVSGN
ncbi:MAG TPA: TraR/DksA family transcriptional regulator [Thermoanaerobaculia bacterium]|nr:TraR/DksA family transcriptional regulator [Thermoanaerobaculia bacterium]